MSKFHGFKGFTWGDNPKLRAAIDAYRERAKNFKWRVRFQDSGVPNIERMDTDK